VSDSLQPDAPRSAGGDTEEVDAVVVASSARSLPERSEARAVVPAVQAAAVAAGSFVAGAAMVGLAHRRQQRRELMRASARRGRGSRGMGELVHIVGSRSLLVDVHLLGGRN
jgi:hypothetical protein